MRKTIIIGDGHGGSGRYRSGSAAVRGSSALVSRGFSRWRICCGMALCARRKDGRRDEQHSGADPLW